MKIRSITSFFDPAAPTSAADLHNLKTLNNELRAAITSLGYEVESQRLATPPFSTYLTRSTSEKIATLRVLESQSREMGWDYLSAGPATPDRLGDYTLIPEFLAETQTVFFSGVIADEKAVYPLAARACADVITRCSTLQPNGFSNLYFAALANVTPHAPFFPAAYHVSGQPPAFSFAMECADAAVNTFSGATSLEEARASFLGALEFAAAKLTAVCQNLAAKYAVEFKGFDFSPAPFPEEWCSLGKAFECLGLKQMGQPGSLAVAAFIADTLDQGNWLKVGFNGLMLAVLEDSVLAARAAEGSLTVKDLLLYSAVCGTGLDTIPMPGDLSIDQLTGTLLDLGALATRLGKPLTGRLMPIPGKRRGDKTEFDFGYFANSRVMALDSGELKSPLALEKRIPLTPRKH
jgi:uncharacterized protein (UPF0210 family)